VSATFSVGVDTLTHVRRVHHMTVYFTILHNTSTPKSQAKCIYTPHQKLSVLYNPIDVPSCHDHRTERYHWRQYAEADNSFSDPEFSALALIGCTHRPWLRTVTIMVTEKIKPPTAIAGPAKR
jgi:hypothetical protein